VDVNVRPALRPGVGAAVDENGHLRLMKFAHSVHLVYEVSEAVIALVARLDGTDSVTELVASLVPSHPELTVAAAAEVLGVLDADGLLDWWPSEPVSPALSPLEQAVYRRQMDFFREFSGDALGPARMQGRLRDATVAILGVGGTGTWFATYLALCGVRNLRLVDPDVVESSNLSRQLTFGIADVGRPKAHAAAATLGAQFGELLDVEAIACRVHGPETISPIVDGCDLVVNCADEPDIDTASEWVAEACMPRGIPHLVGGGYDGHTGLIGPMILPGRSACWECFQTHHRARHRPMPLRYITPTRRRHTGAFAPLAALVTSVQSWDAVRVLSGGNRSLLADRHGEVDFESLSIRWTEVPRVPDCPLCRRAPGVMSADNRQCQGVA
jgi:molybdopterin-synthase adenylyltransferase